MSYGVTFTNTMVKTNINCSLQYFMSYSSKAHLRFRKSTTSQGNSPRDVSPPPSILGEGFQGSHSSSWGRRLKFLCFFKAETGFFQIFFLRKQKVKKLSNWPFEKCILESFFSFRFLLNCNTVFLHIRWENVKKTSWRTISDKKAENVFTV